MVRTRKGFVGHSFPYCFLLVRDSGWVPDAGIFGYILEDEFGGITYGETKTSQTNIINVYDKWDVFTWAITEHHQGTDPTIIARYITFEGNTMYGHHPTDDPTKINIFDVDYVLTYDGEFFDEMDKHLMETFYEPEDVPFPEHMGEYLKEKFGNE